MRYQQPEACCGGSPTVQAGGSDLFLGIGDTTGDRNIHIRIISRHYLKFSFCHFYHLFSLVGLLDTS